MFLWIRLNSELLRYQGVQNFAKNNTENTFKHILLSKIYIAFSES